MPQKIGKTNAIHAVGIKAAANTVGGVTKPQQHNHNSIIVQVDDKMQMHNTGTINGHNSRVEKRSKSRKEQRSGSEESLNNVASVGNINYGTDAKAGSKKSKIISSFTEQQNLIPGTIHDTSS